MHAFNNNPKLKTDLLSEVAKHREADQIIKGTYGHFSDGSRFRGCAVGCSLHSYGLITGKEVDTSDHKTFEEFGIPLILARLQDRIFEGLPETHRTLWPEKFFSAINPGADLTGVWRKFAIWLLIDAEHGVIKYSSSPDTGSAIQRVAELYEINGTREQFIETSNASAASASAYAADAAASAAASASAYAADAAAASASASAADAASAAAAYAAYAADAAYASAASRIEAKQEARYKAFIAQSEKLTELMSEAI